MSESKEENINPEDWLDLYGDYLYRFAISRVRDTSLAEDLVQDTLLSAFKNIETFQGKSSLKTWLATILKNKIFDHFKNSNKHDSSQNYSEQKEKSQTNEFNEFGIWKVYVPDWARNPEELLEDQQFQDIFQNCTSKLAKRLSLIFQYKYIDGIETEEICKLLDISESNLWVMLYRIRNSIRNCLEKNWYKHK